jgi:hypothetical protein
MRRMDGQARALYRLMTMPALAALKNCSVIPPDGQTGGTKESQFIKDMFFLPPAGGGMVWPFKRFIKQMLLALFTGFSAWELIYWQPETGPLKGKWTLREIGWRPSETLTFLLDGQGQFNGFRQRCWSGDTFVHLLDGTDERMDRLAERWAAGERFWVYSCTEDGRVVPGKVTHAKKVSDSEPLVEVTLDNGEKVRCTLTHPWMLKDGTYKRAANLKPGDSLMPLYRQERRLGVTQKYEQVWHPGRGKWEFTHRMVSRELGFAAGPGEVIHHGFAGLKHRNNDPRNLRRMTQDAHKKLHGETSIQAARAATDPAVWGNHSEITFRDIDQAARAIVAAGSRLSWEKVAGKLGCSQDVIYDRIWDAGFPSWKDYKWSLLPRTRRAHRISERRQEQAEGRQADNRRVPVTFRDIDQAAREFVAIGQVFGWRDVARALETSQDVIYARVRAEGFTGWKDYKVSLTSNHKVAAVRFVEPEAVYDIEVEGYHNFALTAGVFVHNTFFQGRTIDVKIQRDNSFYFANEEAERPFYGVSMFESAFYHYDKVTKLYFIAHLAAQRKAVGTRVGTMPPNPPRADKEGFIKAMADLGMAQYIVVPNADWQVTVLNDGGAAFDFLGLINHHKSQMSKSILAQWFDEDQGGSEGDSTLVDFGKQSDVTFMMMLESFLEDMAQTINHDLIPRFIDWNFGSGLYPQFKWGQLTAEQRAAVQEIFTQLAAAGPQANVSPEFMIELEQRMADELGLDIDYDKLKAERKKQQDLLDQQYGGQGMTQMGVNGQPQPPQMPGQFGQDMGQGGPGGGPGGPPGSDQGQQSGIPGQYLPDNFQQVQASARSFVDDLVALARDAPELEGAPA